MGLRGADQSAFDLVAQLLTSIAIGVALPVLLAGLLPRRPMRKALYILVLSLAGVFVFGVAMNLWAPPFAWPASIQGSLIAAFALTAYFIILEPFVSNSGKLGLLAPVAMALGVIGASGYLMLETLWGGEEGAAMVAVGMAAALAIGVTIVSEFSTLFAAGRARAQAAAAAGHSAVAITAFSILAVASLFGVQTFNANFGAVEWRVLWAAVTVAAAAMVSVMVVVTGALSLTPLGEQAAVNENRRRQWFSHVWRPLRSFLPAPTAMALTAIAGVLVVIAMFEAQFSAPLSLSALFFCLWLAAGISLVSIRASLLVISVLTVCYILSNYFYAVFGLALPDLLSRMTGVTLCAVSLTHWAAVWRDAGDVWRSPVEVTEHSLSDGMRRYLFMSGVSAASLFVAAQTFSWPGGASAVGFFVIITSMSVVLTPVFIIAMSVYFRRI